MKTVINASHRQLYLFIFITCRRVSWELWLQRVISDCTQSFFIDFRQTFLRINSSAESISGTRALRPRTRQGPILAGSHPNARTHSLAAWHVHKSSTHTYIHVCSISTSVLAMCEAFCLQIITFARSANRIYERRFRFREYVSHKWVTFFTWQSFTSFLPFTCQ